MNQRSTILLFLICFISLLSCNHQPKIKTFGFITDRRADKQRLIKLNSQTSFSDLGELISEVVCNDSIPMIEIKENRITKHIRIFGDCSTTVHCYTRRNVLSIKDEQIYLDTIYSLDHLETLVEKHYMNNSKSMYFSKDPYKAFIEISYDKIGCQNLPKVLDVITDSFDKLNLDVPLVIKLRLPAPPPPSPPLPI